MVCFHPHIKFPFSAERYHLPYPAEGFSTSQLQSFAVSSPGLVRTAGFRPSKIKLSAQGNNTSRQAFSPTFTHLKSTPFLIQASEDLPSFPSRAGDKSSSWICCCWVQGFVSVNSLLQISKDINCLDLAGWKLKGKQRMAGLISHSASREQ